ncbi:MAG TPA: hypothetical protein VG013_18440 [Gemmataceae bacterium]|nr:hypothetical protein [Gemmataceae bacterium]
MRPAEYPGYGVVGQRGFFDLLKVTFDFLTAEVELRPYESAIGGE